MTRRRWLACAAASVIAAAGMRAGHVLAGALGEAGGESRLPVAVAVFSWVMAGAVAALIDRRVPSQVVAAASLVLPLLWVASLADPLWLLGLPLLALFALITGLSAAATKYALRGATRS